VLQDEFYFRYIVKHNLFESIIGAFVANGNRYNLLNSAVLELIDFILFWEGDIVRILCRVKLLFEFFSTVYCFPT
jgi:hypothetical protein